MLQAIRERITGIVAIFVLGLLAVPFLFFGVESYIRAVPQDAVATVGDDEISTSEFQTSFARYRGDLRQRLGDDYDEIATNQPTVRREHLEGMIDQMLLRQHAQRLGLQVTDTSMFEIIRQVPGFQVDGQFSPELYQQMLRGTGRTARSFERELRDDLLMRTVPTALSASAIVTEAEIDRMISIQKEQRRIALVEVSAQTFEDQVEITDADVETYFQENQSSFMTTEMVRVAYVELDAAGLTQGLELSDEELRQRYEAARQRYLTPEARRASHVLIDVNEERDQAEARALAASLREELLEGASFEAMAETWSTDSVSADEGGDLGWIEPGEMVEPFEDALYELSEVGEFSEPVQTSFGWHIIRLDEIRPPQGMSFEEAREEILAEYIERESEALYIELSERLVDLVYADDSTLEPLAAELGLEIRHTVPFPRNGGEGIAANQRVVEAAFSDMVLLDGTVSDPIELERNRLVVIKLDEHMRAEPRPLEEVAERIRDRLLSERSSSMAREQADRLHERLASGEESFEDLAAEDELAFEEHEAVTRNDFQLGFNFINELFRLPAPGDAASFHVVPKGNGFAVVRLEEVLPGNPAVASDGERQAARQQIQFAHMGYEVSGLLAWLRDETRIRVVEDRL